jgi:hypothetical protein
MIGKIIKNLFSSTTTSPTPPDAPPSTNEVSGFRPGDILVQKHASKGWGATKVLAIDEHPQAEPTIHCLSYDWVRDEPQLSAVPTLPVRIWHAPFSAKAFAQGWRCIGNLPVGKDDLKGFATYLKFTDFKRYAQVTNQTIESIVARANARYAEAYRLGTEGKRIDSIRAYEEAIDLFPMFYEAIDNRAFTFMELGDCLTALSGFEHSLRVNPDGVSAFFSRGECLLKLGRLNEAETVFAEGLGRFPEQKDMFQRFLDMTRSAKGGGISQSP